MFIDRYLINYYKLKIIFIDIFLLIIIFFFFFFYIGNESGLGEIRRNELESSCITLGIDIENINIIDHP